MREFVGGVSMDNSTPIKGVDGIVGVVLMLSYLAGGKDMFPAGVQPMSYIKELRAVPGGNVLVLDDERLSRLVDACARAVHRHLKGLTMGSLSVYMCNLRNGQRPNGGVLPPVPSSYSKAKGILMVGARSYDADVATGVFDTVPDWVRAMA